MGRVAPTVLPYLSKKSPARILAGLSLILRVRFLVE